MVTEHVHEPPRTFSSNSSSVASRFRIFRHCCNVPAARVDSGITLRAFLLPSPGREFTQTAIYTELLILPTIFATAWPQTQVRYRNE
jgi:hypothetical protein